MQTLKISALAMPQTLHTLEPVDSVTIMNDEWEYSPPSTATLTLWA